MSDTTPEQELEKKVLEFTETSMLHVKSLEKRSAAAEARVAELEKELNTAETERAELEKKASAPVEVFDVERVRELSELLCASGFVKESSEDVQESFKSDPNSVLGVFSEMIQSGSDGSELTTIKSSREHKPDLWKQAVSN